MNRIEIQLKKKGKQISVTSLLYSFVVLVDLLWLIRIPIYFYDKTRGTPRCRELDLKLQL